MSDFLNMSDEDFLNAGEPHETLEESGSEMVEEASPEGEALPEEVDTSTEPEQLDEDYFDDEGDDEPSDQLPDTDEPVDEDAEDSEETPEDETPEEDESDATGSEELARILQPFKANGKEIQVKNVDEALTLMQMGANFTKKMQALQPNMKVLKTLEKHDLLDESKLNFLIDLNRGDPKAIAKLVQEAKIDPVDLEEDVEYTPNDHQVSDEAVRLNEVLDSLESTPTYAKCIDLVGNQWDVASRQTLQKEPGHITAINEHMQSGIFDVINGEMERVKMLGGLSGLSDFDAYRAVGARLMQEGKLNAPKPVPVATTPLDKPKDDVRSSKRKAASAPKPARKVTKPAEPNPLAMSDEEFIRINNLNV